MTKLLIFIFIAVIVCASSLGAQEYFQQEVNFKIDVKLNDINHSLHASESIEYINNSPDTLYFIWFHLWPNAYKNKHTALARQQIELMQKKLFYSHENDRGYIDSLDFRADGKELIWEYDPDNIDICKVYLGKPLLPGEKVIISTPFYVKIPTSDFSRLGHYGQSYQITQWFPKPAVYDRQGWHQMPYLDMGEFYSEFGSFEVSITLPENYVVGATGNLQDKTEIVWLDSIAAATAKKKNFMHGEIEDFPVSSKRMKTLLYKESNIHDFAWFADKRFNVLKGQVTLQGSGKKVTTWVMFTNYEGRLWKNAIEYVNDAVLYYSKWYGDYAYSQCTAVEGALSAGGGMEYPCITIIGYSGNALSLEEVIMHEVGHNWFYGILGSNEREHPWLDEGINTFSQLRYMQAKYPDIRFSQGYLDSPMAEYLGVYNLPYQVQYEFLYWLDGRRNLDQPCTLSSTEFYALDYFGVLYMKTAFIFNFLLHYLGEKEFDNIMQEYYRKWKFKHPQPEDLRKIFEEKSDKDLSWFFDDMLGSKKKVDYKITGIRKTENPDQPYEFTLKNAGRINSPVPWSLLKDGEIIGSYWTVNPGEKISIPVDRSDFDEIVIDAENIMPDINDKNNNIRKTGLCKKAEPLKLKFLGGLDLPGSNKIYWMPLMAGNLYDGFMAGGIIYNSLLPMKKFEFMAMPFYGFESQSLAGNTGITYHIFPVENFERIDLSLSGMQYSIGDAGIINRLKFTTDFWIRNRKEGNNAAHHLYLQAYYLKNIEELVYNAEDVYLMLGNARYEYKFTGRFNPWSWNVNLQAAEEFGKAWAEGKYRFSYTDPRKGFNIRVFAGTFLYESDEYYGNYNFRLSGWNGYQDYLFENIFPGRVEAIKPETYNKFWANQFLLNDGGFALNTPLGQTNEWLAAINLTAEIPIPVPVAGYFNAGTWAGINDFSYSKNIAMEAGVNIIIIRNVAEVYFPILVSGDLKYVNDLADKKYIEKVRFTLNLKLEDIAKLIQNYRL
ncbi:MAG: M1 family metallopeptidase [Bacteroidota bacterium]